MVVIRRAALFRLGLVFRVHVSEVILALWICKRTEYRLCVIITLGDEQSVDSM